MTARTAESWQASANRLEAARSSGASKVALAALSKSTGVKGSSLFFAPSTDDRERYPYLQYFWKMGHAAAPYDAMHLILLKVVPLFWKLFAGELQFGDQAEDYVLDPAVVQGIGRELEAARLTVPLSQARSLRNLAQRFRSYKAVDWLVFVVSTGEAVLAGGLPTKYFDMFMALSRACRLLFQPRGLATSEIQDIEAVLRPFCASFYSLMYRGQANRVSLCRSTIVGLLDVASNIQNCGLSWVYWQFPMERYIGTLPMLIKSRSSPHAGHTWAVSRRYIAELSTRFAESCAPAQ